MTDAGSVRTAEDKPELTKYELLEEIGHGGMATVYRAVDKRLGREVAVKVIHKHLRESGEVAARFTSEARAVARLRHPNIVEVYDVADADEPERYLVVELVRGTTLRRILRARSKLPPEIAVAVALEVAAALDHAHRHGVVHRDVKPENVLVELPPATSGPEPEAGGGGSGRALVKITDFGIAKLLDAQGVTSTGQVLGSPAHMAPEQIEGDEVTPRADVFALGVLLYESMVGALPFDGKNPAQMLRRVLEGAHTPADRARPTVGTGWSRIIERALARSAADRHESAAEFAADLRAELKWLGFDKPRQELASYLRAPEQYWQSYLPRIIARLVEHGQAARARRDIPLAAACFNRALAFRPDDPELLGQVTGLAHAARVRRMLVQGAGTLLAVGALGAAVYGAVWLVGDASVWRPVRGSSQPAKGPHRGESAAGPALAARDLAAASAERAAAARESRAPAAVRLRPRVRAVPPREQEPIRRPVRVNIQGAQGGKLTIDGQPAQWFKTTHSLVVGRSYVFGFVPPDQECCEGSTQTVTIEEGTGELLVQGTISFKPAVLSTARVPNGSTVSCGLYGLIPVPGEEKVEMNGGELTISCVVTTPDGKEKTKQVTLRPGKTTLLSWP